MSIRRIVQLVIDRNAAKRAEVDTQKSLVKGTDPKRPERNLGRIRGALGGLRSLAVKLGAALGAAFVVRQLKRFGEESVRVATEARGIWNRLAGQLRVAGVEFSNVEGEISRTARALQDVTGVGDEDFAAIMTELVGTTNDYASAMAEVETVANLAAAKQIDLRTAAQLVGRAMVGQTGALSRYGIIVAKGADAMEVLRSRFAGMARNEARSLEGRVKQLSNEWADFQQAIGDAMIEAGGGTSVLDTLIGTVKALTIWVNENQSAIAFWGSLLIDVFKAVARTTVGLFALIRSTANVVASYVVLSVRNWQLVFVRGVDLAASAINKLIEGLNHLPGVDIDFRMGGMDVERFEAQRNAALDMLKDDLGDVVDALVEVGQGWVDVGTKAFFAEQQQRSASQAGPDGSGAPSPESDEDEIAKSNERWLKHREAMAQGDAAAQAFREAALDTLKQKASSTAEGMTSAFQGFFDATATGFEGTQGILGATAEAARGVGASIVEGLTEGRAEEQMAQGVAKLAEGTWPPNPVALLAAGKHFAAAALFRAIPGAIRGAGGGGGSAVPRGAIATSRPGTRDPIRSEFNIYLDPLSPADPRFQRVVFGANQNAQERFGDNVRVNVRPRSATA